jgi:hypothetical protein
VNSLIFFYKTGFAIKNSLTLWDCGGTALTTGEFFFMWSPCDRLEFIFKVIVVFFLFHSGTHPFNCTSCEFRTKVKPAFREHLEKEHGIKYREEIHGCKESTKKILDTIRKPRNGVIMNYC